MRAVHPGEILAGEFAEIGVSVGDAADALGVGAERIEAITDEREGISADMALRLGRYFGTTAQFWMNLQKAYELRSAEIAAGDAIAKRIRHRDATRISGV